MERLEEKKNSCVGSKNTRKGHTSETSEKYPEKGNFHAVLFNVIVTGLSVMICKSAYIF